MSRVDGKSAIVTGAAAGLGRAFAEALGRAGAHVTICDISPTVEQTAQELRAAGPDVQAVQADASDPDDVLRVVQAAASRTGTVDVLVNNVGIVELTTPLDDWDKSLRDFDRVIGTNLRSAFLFGRACAPLMAQQGFGEIVNISTDHVHTCGWPEAVGHSADTDMCPWRDETRPTGWVYLDLYDASKWALNGLTQCWAKMLRPHGVRVNNICLGATDSLMQRTFFGFGYEPGTEPPAELLDWWMKPGEVARVLMEVIEEGPHGRSGDNIGLWLGHPTVLPAPDPVLNVPLDFDIAGLADLTTPPAPRA